MADFQFFLNRQGPRGPKGYKGDKGDDGKTPMPRTGTNTPIETTVIFDTGNGNTYETPNLKYQIEDRGGNMVMLDRTNSTQYYGTPDQATDNSYGVVKLATSESILDDPLDNDVVTFNLFANNNQAIQTAIDGLTGDITQLNTDLGIETTNRTNADTQLTNKINTDVGNEATARTNADNALSGRIDNLTTTKADKSDLYTKTQTDSLLNNKSNVGHTHNYNDLTNKPTIGNGTITITQGGVTKGSFTTNQFGNQTIALESGGGGGTSYTAGNGIDLTNNAITVKVDGNTIGFDSSGNLTATTYTLPTATTSTLGGVKIDGTSITINDDGVISAAKSAPNLVTTNTEQTITNNKRFSSTNGLWFGTGTPIKIFNNNDGCLTVRNNPYGGWVSIGSENITVVGDKLMSVCSSNDTQPGNGSYFQANSQWHGYLFGAINSGSKYYNQITTYNEGGITDYKIYRNISTNRSISLGTNFLLEKDMLDGTTIQYNPTSEKVEVIGGIIKKTITQDATNVSELSGVVTVTDADVTTSTLVTLYPGDTTTEAWLANNLSSNIITEGTGSFTFSISDALPSTFSMYYTIQGVK